MIPNHYIKFCPCCGGQNLDTTSYGSEGHAQCKDCKAIFTVDAISVNNKEQENKKIEKQKDKEKKN